MDLSTTVAPSPTPIPAATNFVSWQSAFWGLVPFAVNSMTQPAGLVCGAPTTIAFMLRSSPIICLIDVVFLLICYLYYLYKMGDFVEAHTQLLLFRFQEKALGDGSQEGSYRNLQRNTIFRVVVFLLTCSQSIKLFAYGGLIGTKVIASMYLISFLVIEALLVFPNAVWPRTTASNTLNPIRVSGFTSVPYISIAAASILPLWFLSLALQHMFDNDSRYPLSRWIGIAVFGVGLIPSVPALLYGIAHRAAWYDVVLQVILWLFLTGVPCMYYFSGPPLEMLNISSQWSTVISSALLGIWVLLGLTFASSIAKPIVVKGRKEQEPLENSFGWYFFLVNLITAVLYYRSGYNPGGTSQPGWTSYLG